MKKSYVGVGIIGCGGRIDDLLGRLPYLGSRIRLVYLHDPKWRAVDYFQRKYNIDAVGYADYRRILSAPSIDWVIVGSPNKFHCEHVVASLNAGKHVFAEKPLATTLKECVDIHRAYKKSKKLFATGFVLRYSRHYRTIKKLIDGGKIGKIISFEFNETLDFNHGGFIMVCPWRRLTKDSGGHLLEKCCHDFDLANWMAGSVARKVASFGGLNFFVPRNKHHIRRIGKDKQGRDAYSAWPRLNPTDVDPFTSDKDIVDNQVVILEYANGVRSTFHTNCNAALPERRMYILGTEGAIRADLVGGRIQLKRIGHRTKVEDYSGRDLGGHGGADEAIAVSLADSMLHGTRPLCSGEEGLRSAITCIGAEDAMHKGKVVDLAPYWKKTGVRI